MAGGALDSSEDSEKTQARRIPNLESSIDSDNPEDTETDGDDHTMESQQRRRRYIKKTTTRTGATYPTRERISNSNMPPEEPILSQGQTDKKLAYLHKSANMRREIGKASTPLEGIIMPPPRLLPVKQPGLRQKLQFD